MGKSELFFVSCKRNFSQPVANIFQHLARKAARCINKVIPLAFMTSLSIFSVFSCLDPASRTRKFSQVNIKVKHWPFGKKSLQWTSTTFSRCALRNKGELSCAVTGNLTQSTQTQARQLFFSLHFFYFLAEFRRILTSLPITLSKKVWLCARPHVFIFPLGASPKISVFFCYECHFFWLLPNEMC